MFTLILLALVLSAVLLVSASIIPSDVYIDNIVFNGKASTQQVMTFTCSETNNKGTLIVGNYLVNVTCNNPISNYALTEIARIPAVIEPLQNLACLVTDVSAYNQALLTQADQIISSTLSAGRRRRLLQLDPFADIASIINLAEIPKINAAYSLAQQDQTNIGILNTSLSLLTGNVTKLGGELQNLFAIVNQTNQEIIKVNNATIQDGIAISNLEAYTQAQTIAINNLTANTQAAVNALQAEITTNLNNLADFLNNNIPNATAKALANITTIMLNLTGSLQTQVNQILLDIQSGFTAENILIAAQEDIQSNRLLLQGLTAQVQSTIAGISEDMFIYETDPGVFPTPLTGIDLRNLQEAINVNYVTPIIGPRYEVHNVVMNFYLDTGAGLKLQIVQGTFTLLISTMIQYFGSENCTRTYIAPDWNGPLDLTPDGTTCTFYVEVVDTFCTTTVSPKFSWGSVTSPTLGSAACGTAPAFTNYAVLRTFTDYWNYVAVNLCPKRGNDTDNFYIWLERAQIAGTLNPPSGAICNAAWDAQLASIPTSGQSLAQVMLVAVNQVWGLANVDLSNKRLKLYGALPGGITINSLPYLHFPVGFNSTTGLPIYSGSAQPSQCLKAIYNAVSFDTLPVYNIVPTNPKVTRTITVEVGGLNGYVCDDPASCYPVGTSIITSDIIAQDDSPPPQQSVNFVGSLLPSLLPSQGLFDIPDEELICATNTMANANTVCYTKMAPGTAQTLTLNQWEAYTGQTYDSTLGTVSASDSRVPVAFDSDGFPICANAVQTYAVNTSDLHGCNLPFTYRNNPLPNITLAATTFNKPTECVQTGSIPIFQNFQDSFQLNILGTSAAPLVTVGGRMSFWFRSPVSIQAGAGTEVIIVEIKGVNGGSTSYLRYLVDINGLAAVVLSTSASSETLSFDTRTADTTGKRLITQNLRDGVLHQIVWISTVSNYNLANSQVIYQLYVDNIPQGTWTSPQNIYMRTSSNPVFFQSALNTVDLSDFSDIINMGIMNTNLASLPAIPNSYSCEQAWFGSMCAGSETLRIARMNVTGTNAVYCDPNAQVLLSTSSFDTLYPQGAVGSAFGLFNIFVSWSISFWIRIPNQASYVNLVTLQNNFVNFKITLNPSTKQLNILVNSVVLAAITLVDLNAHFIYVTYTGSTAIAYLDGVLFTSANIAACGSGCSGTQYSIASGLNYISMLKYYNGEASPFTKVQSEQACMISSTVNSLFFIPPIGFCEQSTVDPLHAYCRSPLLCNGHCSAYSTFDITTRTFVPGSLQCDNGFQAPDCTTSCLRVDESNGICIDSTQTYANGLTPLGFFCQLTGDYQLTMNLQSNQLFASGRQYLYLVTIRIPLGTVSSIVGSGSCPQLTMQNFGTNGLLAIFQNSDSQEANIQVFYAPNIYYENAGSVECVPSCCNANTEGSLISIPAFASSNLPIPQCGNMTVSVSILTSVTPQNSYTLCTALSGSSLTAAIVTGNNQQNALLVSTVQAYVNTAQLQILAGQTAISTALINALIVQASLNNATNIQLLNLLELRNEILAAGATVNFNYSGFATVNISSGVSSTLNNAQQDLNNVNNALALANQYSQEAAALNALITNQLNNGSAQVKDTINNIIETQTLLAAIQYINPSYSGTGGLGDFLSTFGTFVANTATSAVSGTTGFFQSALGSVFGGLSSGIGGFFGSIISELIPLVIIVAVAYVCYWLYQKNQASSEEKKKKKDRQDEEDEEERRDLVRKHRREEEQQQTTTPTTPAVQKPTSGRWYNSGRRGAYP